MKNLKLNILKILVTFSLVAFFSTSLKSEEEKIDIISNQIKILTQDLKTLEKAIYKSSDVTSSSSSISNNLNEDVLTKHLLKLNEIEEQFRSLTNRFEEINFKIDKLSSRVTKIQSDTQLRFSDLESGKNEFNSSNIKSNTVTKKLEPNLPGSAKPQDFGSAPAYQTKNLPENQETQSIETAGTVITEQAEQTKSLLPNKAPKEQYEFAVSFMKIGD